MKLLFIADPLSRFSIKKESTFALMRAAHQRGDSLYFCEPQDLLCKKNEVWGQIQGLQFNPNYTENVPWYTLAHGNLHPLHYFDAVLLRKDPPFDLQYVTTTWLLEIAERSGVHIFNRPSAVRNHSEKLSILEFPQWIAPTLVTAQLEQIRIFHQQYPELILKPLDAMGGLGVFKITADGQNLESAVEILTEQGKKAIMVQRFIPEITQGDKRILIVGGQVVPYALARLAQASEVRANMRVGGKTQIQPLSERDHAIAYALAPILMQRGLHFVGLDIIGDYLTEINTTSPTGIQEIEHHSGFNAANLYLDTLN